MKWRLKMTTKIIAETHFDHAVKLTQIEEHGFGLQAGCVIYLYRVTYGMHTRDCGSDFESAWREFLECSTHAAQCASLLQDQLEQGDE